MNLFASVVEEIDDTTNTEMLNFPNDVVTSKTEASHEGNLQEFVEEGEIKSINNHTFNEQDSLKIQSDALPDSLIEKIIGKNLHSQKPSILIAENETKLNIPKITATLTDSQQIQKEKTPEEATTLENQTGSTFSCSENVYENASSPAIMNVSDLVESCLPSTSMKSKIKAKSEMSSPASATTQEQVTLKSLKPFTGKFFQKR